MRPSTVPVFAFAKAGHSNGGRDRGRAYGGGDLQKKRVTLAYPRDVQPPYLAIIAVCNKRPGFAFTKNGHPKKRYIFFIGFIPSYRSQFVTLFNYFRNVLLLQSLAKPIKFYSYLDFKSIVYKARKCFNNILV